ncbi:MAG: methionine--tRNA ligase [Methanospirillum sp.]|mgnify:CR=1 FL=1|nr:methionine--tRNA ligase [Methanospirillum sp.]
MSDAPRLVTCGLPYTNGPCHFGHLRTYVPADMYVRYMRLRGEEVVFICGSDNHGTPIVVSAEAEGTTPAELSRRYHDHFDTTFRRMGVVFDHFGMTDGETNHRRTRRIIRALEANGHVYAERVEQSYCSSCRRFLPDRYVKGLCPHCGAEARGDECDQGCGKHLEPGEIREPVCTVCDTPAELREQEHYFFRLSSFEPFLLEHLEHLKGTANARNYALGWVRDGLRDWCITRTLDWGVRYPGREDLVVYVWVDAPIGYISFTEEWAAAAGADWRRYWCGGAEITHFIGGDITYHHCIFWPALLEGAGYGLPNAVVASGMLKVDDHKFSKSRGYVVWTNEDYLDLGLPADCLRYYLVASTSHTRELNFSWRAFADRVNNELVNTFGNFVHRTLHFAHTRFGGIPAVEAGAPVLEAIRDTLAAVDRAMEEYEFKVAVDAVMGLAAQGNNLIQANAPWKLVKTDPEAASRVIADALQIVKALALLIDPVMPETAARIWSMLGQQDGVEEHRLSESTEPLEPGHLALPAPLFARIEETRLQELEAVLEGRVAEAERRARCEPDGEAPLTIDEFARMELVIARVVSAEPIQNSKKLLRLVVDIGAEEREIVSGIAGFYAPSDLVGRDVVVIANLAPATLFGVESRGMILAAGDEASLLVPLRPVEPGTRVR